MSYTYKILILFLISSFTPLSNAVGQNIDMHSYKFNFTKREQFIVRFADYPKGEENFFELDSKQNARLPLEIHSALPGLKISGNNHSDDLFMYAYTKINGLKPNTQYHIQFSLEFASNAPQDSMGAGGSPGSSVYMKIGALSHKPKQYLDKDQYWRVAFDKGTQSNDGNDMVLIGNFGADTTDDHYRLKTLPYNPSETMQAKLENFYVTSNAKGELWIMVGSDSGYESTTTIYYTSLSVNLKSL